jgi:uncharacterized protein DUF5069
MVDKARASQADTLCTYYRYPCPIDAACLDLLGIDADTFRDIVNRAADAQAIGELERGGHGCSAAKTGSAWLTHHRAPAAPVYFYEDPYEAHLIVLAYIYSKAGNLSETQVRHARQWFWRTAFTEHSRGASEAFVSRDLAASTRS